MGDFRWELVACSFVSWILVYFALWKSVRSSGRVLYFTATIPFLLIFVFLCFSLTLDGSEIGLRYFFLPNFELLSDHKVSFFFQQPSIFHATFFSASIFGKIETNPFSPKD